MQISLIWFNIIDLISTKPLDILNIVIIINANNFNYQFATNIKLRNIVAISVLIIWWKNWWFYF